MSRTDSTGRLDPLAVSVAANRLTAVLEEQQATLVRSAFSTIVRESEDLACGVFDRRGEMVAQSRSGTPGHINAMATGVRHLAEAFPEEVLRPGDVLVTNDPWLTAGQVNDLTVVTPGFRGEDLVGFFASTCHAPDIGGRLLSGEANEVFEEGLRIPVMHLARAGVLNEDLIAVIRANVRTPDETVGDLLAQAAANDVGILGLLRVLDEFDLDSVDPLGEEICRRSEAALREAIGRLPDGVYRQEGTSDGFDEPVSLKVAVEIAGDELTVDFAGSSPQSERGINLVLNYTRAYASFALKAAIAPEVPHNAGSFRPVEVRAPEGSILNCTPPAPVASRHLIGHLLPGIIFGALSGATNGRVMAPGADSIWISVWRGTQPGSAEPFNLTLFQSGGTGARPGKDGVSVTGFPAAVASVPTEVLEQMTSLVHRERILRTDSGGPGRNRGGLGQRNAFSCRSAAPWSVSVLADRIDHPAPGIDGGGAGAAGSLSLDEATFRGKRLTPVGAEGRVRLDIPGGGGLGNPAERPVGLVLADVIDGYVSIEEADRRYGVVVTCEREGRGRVLLPEDYEVDEAATASRRREMEDR